MRVLHVTSGIDPEGGGTATAAIGLASAHARAGLRVRMAATWRGQSVEPAVRQLQLAGVETTAIGPTLGPLAWKRGLWRQIDEAVKQADIVHIHALWESIQHHAAQACRRLNVPYVVTPHGMLTRWSLGQHRLRKQLMLRLRVESNLRAAAALHFATAAERDASDARMAEGRVFVEPFGVNLDEFRKLPPAGRFRARHAAVAARPMIVFLGRIHPGKGLEYLVPALARLRCADAVLAVIGPDSEGYGAQVERAARAHRVADRVLFTGMLRGADRIEALVDADLFALPSDHENFGLAVVEALAAGQPVLVSDQVAIHAEIAAAGVGVVVPNETAAVAAALDEWLGDATRRMTAAERARPFVWANYDWNGIGSRWVMRYRDITSARSGGGTRSGEPAGVRPSRFD